MDLPIVTTNTATNTAPPANKLDTTDFASFEAMFNDPKALAAAEASFQEAQPRTTEVDDSNRIPTENEGTAQPNTEVAATTEEGASDDEDDDDDDEDDENGEELPPATDGTTPPKKKSGYKRQIERLEAAIAALEAKQNGTAPTTQPVTKTEPVVTQMPKLSDPDIDFDEEKYTARMAQYIRSEIKKETAQTTAEEVATLRAENFNKSQDKLRKTLPDYDAVVAKVSDLKFGVAVAHFITNPPEGLEAAELSYEFSKDRGFAERIATLSGKTDANGQANVAAYVEATRLMGLRAGKILAAKEAKASAAAAAKREPVISRAPAPGKPLSATAGNGKTRTAADIINDYSTTADPKKVEKYALEYKTLTGKDLHSL